MSSHARPNPETVGALLDTTWRLADQEQARTDSLDRKASSLATFAAVALSLTATLGGRFLNAFDAWWAFGLYAAGLTALIAAVALSVRVLLPKEYATLSMEYVEQFPRWGQILKPPEEVRGETMFGLIRAIARERDVNRSKARGVRNAYRSLLARLIFVVLQGSILGISELTR